MTKQKIKWIIGIMGLALAGIIYLQVYSIRQGIRMNSERFDRNVYSALAAVASRLELNERQDAIAAINGYSALQIEKNTDAELPPLQDFMQNTLSKVERNHPDKFGVLNLLTQKLSTLPIQQRIPVDELESFIRTEMHNHGIKAKYNYGIFDNSQHEFVIYDGHYLVEHGGQQIQDRFTRLLASPYSVSLFPQQHPSPGKLIVEFPSLKNYIRSTLMPFIIAAALFTSVIMAIFSYTILVILRQKKISEMKSDFMNNMTHEFKTPIATISLAADSITNPAVLNEPEKVKRFAQIIKQENRRMHQQVERVLDSARWERKEVQIKPEKTDLHLLIRKVVKNFELQVADHGGEITLDLQATDPVLSLDFVHVSNVLLNLLDNANKYCTEKPKISIRTRNVKGGIEVLIADNGIGISREDRKQIFEKFYRVHTGNRHDVKGFGLGLAYVKTIVELHGGKVAVDSEPGKGSKFYLTFFRKHVTA